MSFPPPIESLTLRVTTGVSPSVEIFEQDILPSDLSGTTNNSVQIAPNSTVFNAFNTKQPGTIFNASIVASYGSDELGNALSILSTPSVSNFVPNPLILSSFGPFSYNYVSGGVGTFTLSQPSSNSNSPGAFTYSVVGTTGIVSVSTNVVTILSAGSTTIRATQAAAGGYTSAYVEASVTINPIAPTFGSFSIASRNFGDIPFTLTAPTSNSTGAFTYTSSAPSIASVHPTTGVVTIVSAGTTTIRATQAAAGNYTSAYVEASVTINPIAPTLSSFSIASRNFGDIPFTLTAPTSNSTGAFTYTSSNLSVATVNSTTGVVTIVSAGTTTIRATQAAAGGYASAYVEASVTINMIAPTLSNFSVASKDIGDIPFTLTAPTSNSSGAFTYTSSTPSVATVSGNTVTVVGEGTSTITATQAATTNYTSGTIDAPFVVNLPAPTLSSFSVASRNFGDIPNTFTLTAPISNVLTTSIITSTASAMIEPPNIDTLIYGAPWTQIGGDIDGESTDDESGFSIACSGDGSIIAVGSRFNSGSYSNAGHVRVYIRNSSKLSSNSLGPAGWDQIGGDIDGEAADNFSGSSVSLSASGNIVAIGANYNSDGGIGAGQVRVYIYNESKTTANSLGPAGWDQIGGDINGEYAGDESGGTVWNQESIKLSADGTIIVIGAAGNDVNGTDSGHARVYRYNPNKSTAQTNQSLAGFGPAGWDRLGADIDGEAINDYSGYSVYISADGTTVSIGAWANDGNGGDSGHVRVYRYNPNKSTAQTNQSLAGYGPIGWDRLGADINGKAAGDRCSCHALSADGTIIAVGGSFNNNLTGNVRVYRYNSSKTTANSLGPAGWDQIGGDINGEAINNFSGDSISISADGTIVAIGAPQNSDSGYQAGHVRVYKYNPSKSTAQTNQSLAGFGPIGWDRLGIDINGEAAGDWFSRVALSSDGTTLVTGARFNDGTSGNSTNDRGSARVYNIPTTNALTYSSSNPDIANIYGNLLLIRGVNGSTTITASQTGNTITGRLDVVGTTYTLQYDRYNIFTYTSSTPSVATISGNIATVVGAGTSTITATQSATTNYTSGTIDATLTVTS